MKNVPIITRAGFFLFCVALLLVSTGSNTPAAEKILIGFSQATMNSAWRVAMTEGNKNYAAEHYPDAELLARTRLPSRSAMWEACCRGASRC